MRKTLLLMVAAFAVGALFIPTGPAVHEALAGPATVPEPSSLLLLGTGFAALLSYLRKR